MVQYEKRCSVLKSVNYHKFVLLGFSFSVSPRTSVQKEGREKPQNNDKKKYSPDPSYEQIVSCQVEHFFYPSMRPYNYESITMNKIQPKDILFLNQPHRVSTDTVVFNRILLKRKCNENTVVQFKVFCRKLSGETEENHKTLILEQPVSDRDLSDMKQKYCRST